MRILIDCSQIPQNKSGVGNYAVNLVREIALHDKVNTYFVLVQSDEAAFDEIKNEKLHIIYVKSRVFRKLLFRFLLEQFFIPYFMLTHRIHLVHSLHYSFPLITFGRKKAVTLADMTFFLMPMNHTAFKRHYFRIFIMLAAILANRIIAISESTRQDFLKRFRGAERKVVAIPLGKPNLETQGDSHKTLAAKHPKFDLNGEYILFIGTLEPRKNLKTLILAYHRLNQKKPIGPLMVVGGRGWGYEDIFRLVSNLGLEKKVIFTGFIDDREKFNLLQRATVFVYPSLYEGFGIPVLEALSLGVPTITSNVSSMPEVAGDAALLVDPLNVCQLSAALKDLLENPSLRQKLSIKGIEQASKFNWEKTAKETIAVYGEALKCVQ
ncbi:MAG: glycosyltransferase family 4 protein [Deltaproteobacteria bacterium]|nr:glycosyltransferase family 4 protein [Deltaproteobacteria bacterium]